MIIILMLKIKIVNLHFKNFFYFFQPIFPSNIWRTNLVFLVKKWLSLPGKKYAKGHAWPLRSKKGSG
ncbi:hypothetical protein BIZ35_09935 [Heyndrickxia coagulans]|nr:hypothetical protein BIZ35_09935 [Heyndrickxia coagulans]